MKKLRFSTELAYLIGLAFLALGTAAMEFSDFGVSTVVAPAYLIYRKLSLTLPFVTFGMAEYALQAVVLTIMMLVLRKFRISYLLSFATAVLYGVMLDGIMLLVALIPVTLASRITLFVLGLVFCSLGVSMLFHTYLSPEAYELFVKEISRARGIPLARFKTIYDCVSCAIGVVLSFAFFGLWTFVGVNWGTIVCACVNGLLIKLLSAMLDKRFVFFDALKLRRYFE